MVALSMQCVFHHLFQVEISLLFLQFQYHSLSNAKSAVIGQLGQNEKYFRELQMYQIHLYSKYTYFWHHDFWAKKKRLSSGPIRPRDEALSDSSQTPFKFSATGRECQLKLPAFYWNLFL